MKKIHITKQRRNRNEIYKKTRTMETKKQTLSDKGFEAHTDMEGAYWESDVKEFIRQLKEEDMEVDFNDEFWERIWNDDLDKNEIVEVTIKEYMKKIDKLAGDKLI